MRPGRLRPAIVMSGTEMSSETRPPGSCTLYGALDREVLHHEVTALLTLKSTQRDCVSAISPRSCDCDEFRRGWVVLAAYPGIRQCRHLGTVAAILSPFVRNSPCRCAVAGVGGGGVPPSTPTGLSYDRWVSAGDRDGVMMIFLQRYVAALVMRPHRNIVTPARRVAAWDDGTTTTPIEQVIATCRRLSAG